MIGTNMTDAKQIEMQIHRVKDKLGKVDTKATRIEEELRETTRETFALIDEIKIALAELRSKV